MPKATKVKPMKVLRGGTEPRGRDPVPSKKASKRARTREEQAAVAARELFVRAPSEALATDILMGRDAYPAHLMPLSKRKTLNAEPNTMDNYNPTGERGEQRHTPRSNVGEEDYIDGLTPQRASHLSESWPSSCGTVVDAGQVLRDAGRLNRGR